MKFPAAAVGRFSGAGTMPYVRQLLTIFIDIGYLQAGMKFVRSRIIFLVYLSGVIAFNVARGTQRGNTGLAVLMISLFFESVCFRGYRRAWHQRIRKAFEGRSCGDLFPIRFDVSIISVERRWLACRRCCKRCMRAYCYITSPLQFAHLTILDWPA